MVRPHNQDFEKFLLFNYLKNEVKMDLSYRVRELKLEKNSCVYRPPLTQNYIYEIVNGAVKLGSYSKSGEEYTYDIIYTGDFFGNLKYLNGQFFEFSKTIMDTHLRLYDLCFFKEIITKDPIIAEWFISYIVKRWCIAEKKLGEINERQTIKKIRFLESYFSINIKDYNGKEHTLYELLTKKDLGDLVGATRQTISSALKKHSVLLD